MVEVAADNCKYLIPKPVESSRYLARCHTFHLLQLFDSERTRIRLAMVLSTQSYHSARIMMLFVAPRWIEVMVFQVGVRAGCNGATKIHFAAKRSTNLDGWSSLHTLVEA